MRLRTKSAKNERKSGDFTAFLIKTAEIYEKRFFTDGEFYELAARLETLPERKQNERYVKKAFKNARLAVQREEAKRRKCEIAFFEQLAPEPCTLEILELKAALETLTEYERAFVEMRFFYGYSAKEIAGVFGITRQAATRRIKVTLDKLRRAL